MTVKEAIEILSKLDPEHSLIGQYHDTNGSWPMGWVEIHKVSGNNTMVAVIIRNPERELSPNNS